MKVLVGVLMGLFVGLGLASAIFMLSAEPEPEPAVETASSYASLDYAWNQLEPLSQFRMCEAARLDIEMFADMAIHQGMDEIASRGQIIEFFSDRCEL